MEKIKKTIFSSQLIKGSFILLIGSTLVNFGSYIYQLLMGRMLGPENYGVLTSLIALLYLLIIPSQTILTVVVKFTTAYKAKKEFAKILALLISLSKNFTIIGIIFFLLFIFGKNFIANFLNIHETLPLILTSVLFIISLLSTTNNGILQGYLKFTFLSVNGVFSILLKVGLAYLLVRVGFSVNGAILALISASFFPYLISFYPLRFLRDYKSQEIQKIDWGKIREYATPVLIATLGMTSLYSTDIILVKHFFNSLDAGFYAALAMMGKIVFFASVAIGTVMFPLVSEKFESGQKVHHLLFESLLLVFLSSIIITAAYFFWPEFMISLLYGSKYFAIAQNLGFFALFITLYSLSNILLQFFLSIGRTRVAAFPIGGAIFQVVLIWFFHTSIRQVITASFIVTALLLLALLLYYFYYAASKV